jgi:hypothetical protein
MPVLIRHDPLAADWANECLPLLWTLRSDRTILMMLDAGVLHPVPEDEGFAFVQKAAEKCPPRRVILSPSRRGGLRVNSAKNLGPATRDRIK